MLSTSTFTRPSVAVLAVSLIIAFSFLGCRQTPGPVIPDPHSKWLLSKVTNVNENGGTDIYEYKYNSFHKPFFIKRTSIWKEQDRTSVDSAGLIYDDQQRLVALTLDFDGSGTLDTSRVIEYDASGRVKKVRPPSGNLIGSTVYEYFDNNTKVKSQSYYSAIYVDTVIDTHTFIYDQDGRLAIDTFIQTLIHTGVFDGYDTVVSKYTQYDQHPNPVTLTNMNIEVLKGLNISEEPFITPDNCRKIRRDWFSGDFNQSFYISQDAFLTYIYNEVGLVKNSTIKRVSKLTTGNTSTTTESYKYEYIKVGD